MLVAIHFERCFRSLMKNVILGASHINMFLWIADVPKEIDNSTAATALKYIHNTICSNITNIDVDPELYALVNKKTKLLRNMLVQAKNKRRFYITARNFNSRFVNDYNDVILRHWRANMDLQYIQNAEGAACYVCSYVCKSEPNDLKML